MKKKVIRILSFGLTGLLVIIPYPIIYSGFSMSYFSVFLIAVLVWFILRQIPVKSIIKPFLIFIGIYSLCLTGFSVILYYIISSHDTYLYTMKFLFLLPLASVLCYYMSVLLYRLFTSKSENKVTHEYFLNISAAAGIIVSTFQVVLFNLIEL